MFMPVLTILLICNSGPIAMFIMVHFYERLYREMYMTTILSICFTSAVNFPVYYLRGSAFRPVAKQVVIDWLEILKRVIRSKDSGLAAGNRLGSSLEGTEMTIEVSRHNSSASVNKF